MDQNTRIIITDLIALHYFDHYGHSCTRRFTRCYVYSGDIGHVVNNSVDWKVALPGGWTVVISVEDTLKNDCWSQPVRIVPNLLPPPLPSSPARTGFCLPACLPTTPKSHRLKTQN